MVLPVAVVIPTHNRADMVARCVASVLEQTARAAEVVVVDDASADDSRDVLAAFGDEIQVVANAENRERGASRNAGARSTTAPFLAFLDSDDEWEPTKLERQWAAAEGRSSVTGVHFIDEHGADRDPEPTAPPAEAWDRLPLENLYFGSPSSLVLERAAFDRVGGYPEDRVVQGSEDWVFLLKLRAAGVAPPLVVPDPLVRYRLHSGNSTGSAASLARSMWAAADWADGQVGSAQEGRRRRARVACVIAQNYAREHAWRSVGSWTLRSLRQGVPREVVRTVLLASATSARSVVAPS